MAFQVLTAAVFAAQAIGTATSAVLTAAAAAGTAGLAAAASLASIAYTSYATKKAEADARKNAAQAPRDITVRSATEPAKIIYGTARTSGPVVYTNTAPTPGTNDNNTLWTVISLCSHEVEDITDIWLDGDEITASQINWGGTGGVTSGKYGPIGSNEVTNFYKRLGTSTQSHVSELATAFTDWTSSYQGKNVAYIVSAFELGTATGEGVWAQGAPTNIRAVVKGKKVYDPRKDTTNGGSGAHRLADPTTWEWSNNPALCLADYLFDDRLGLGAEGVTYDDIDWALVIAAANVCDATVSIPGSTTEKRFTCNGALSTGNTYAENIKAILSSMNGQITWSGGKYRIRACAYEAPVYTFTGDDVVGDVQIQPERTRTQRFNTVRGTFVDPESDYVATEFIPYNDSNLQSGRDAGQKLTKDISLPMTNSEYMAQRIGYKMVALNDQQLRCIVPMNWKALKVGVGDRIQLSIDELSWSNKVFRVEGWTFDPDSGFNLTLQEDSSSAYADPGVSDYSTRTLAGTVVFADQPVPSPSNLSASAEEEAVFLQWSNPGRASGYDEIIIYASATSAWSGASEIARTRGTSYRHELARGTTRYYWIRAVDVDGETSIRNPNSDTSSITATAGQIDFANLGGATKPEDNATYNTGALADKDTVATADIDNGAVTIDKFGTGLEPVQVVASLPGTATAGQMAFLTTDNKLYRYNGTAWTAAVPVGDVTGAGDLAALDTITLSYVTDAGDVAALDSISETYIDDNSITTVKINANAVTAAKIQANTITAAQIAANTITANQIAANTITSNEIAANTITAGQIAAGTITAEELAANAVTGQIFDASSYLRAGSGDNSAVMSGRSIDEYAFWAGKGFETDGGPSGADAPFRVTRDGKVIMTNFALYSEAGTKLFDSQDGLLALPQTAVAQASGSLVPQVSEELTSGTDTFTVTLSSTQTITANFAYPVGALFYSGTSLTDAQNNVSSAFAVTLEYSTDSGSTWNTFGSTQNFSKVTSGTPTSSQYLVVANSFTVSIIYGATPTTVYVASLQSNRGAIDEGMTLVGSTSQSLAAGTYLIRMVFSATGGSGSGAPSTTKTREVRLTTSGAGFTVSDGTVSDGVGTSATTGWVLSNFVEKTESDNVTINGTLTLGGDLVVNGTTTTINSTTLTVDDKNIVLADGAANAAAADGAGITINGPTGATFTYNATTDTFVSGKWMETPSLRFGAGLYGAAINSKAGYLLLQKDEALPIELWGSVIESRKTHYFGTGGQASAPANIDTSGNFSTTGTLTASGYNNSNWDTAYTYSQVGHVPLAGGTMSGNLLFSDSGTTKRGIQGQVGTNDYWFIGGGATAANAGFLEIAAGDDGTTAGSYEPIYVRQYLGTPLTGTVQRTLTLLDNNGNTSIPGSISAAALGINEASRLSPVHITLTASGTALTLQNKLGGTGAAVNLDFLTYNDETLGSYANPGARISAVDDGAFGGNLTFLGKANAQNGALSAIMTVNAKGGVQVNSGDLQMGTTSVITASRDLQNVALASNLKYKTTWNGNSLEATEAIHMDAGGGSVLQDSLQFNVAAFTIPVMYAKSGSTWTNIGNQPQLCDGRVAANWGQITLSRSYDEFIFYFGTDLGYTFISAVTLLHSTSGNSMQIYVESSETGGATDTGWTVMASTGSTGSWPGSTTLTLSSGVGGGFNDRFRIRIVPSWDHASNSISLGQIVVRAGYGPVRRLFDWGYDRSIDFVGALKMGGTTFITSDRDITARNIIAKASSDTAVPLRVQRSSASGRMQMTFEDESGSAYWRLGGTGSGSDDFTFFSGTANVLVLDRGTNAATFAGTIFGPSGELGSAAVGGSSTLKVYHTANFEGATFRTNQGGSLARFIDSTDQIEIGIQAGKPVIRTGNTARLKVDGANVQINSGALQMGTTTVIDSSRNLTNISGISSGDISVSSSSFIPLNITGTNSTYTAIAIKNTGTGDAGIYFDASNGDLSGSDYAFAGQKNSLDFEITTGGNAGNINLRAGDVTRLQVDKDGYTLFPTLDLAISNVNSSHGHNTYFRGNNTHFVLGLTDGNTLYLNYGNSTGTLYAQGGQFQWNGTTIIDSSRNLTNIGTISSGAITSTGLLNLSRSATTADVNYLQITMPSWSGHQGYLKSLAWQDGTGTVSAIGSEFDGSKVNIHFHSQYNSGYKGSSVKTFSVYGNGNVNLHTGALQIGGTTVIDSARAISGTALTLSGSSSYVLDVTSTVTYASRIAHNRANSTTVFSDALFLLNTNNTAGNYVSIGLSTNESDGQHHRAQIRASRDGTGTYAGKLEFWTRPDGGGNEVGIRIDSNQDVSLPNGRIGVGKSVGTNDPALDVQGVNTTDGTASFRPNSAKGTRVSHLHYGTTGDWYIRSASTSGTVVIQDSGGSISLCGATVDSARNFSNVGTINSGAITSTGQLVVDTDTEHQIKIDASAASGASMHLNSAGGYAYTVYQNSNKAWRIGAYGGSAFTVRNHTDNSDPLVITSGGTVGINKSSPDANSKLHVDGHIFVDTGHALYSDNILPYATYTLQYGNNVGNGIHNFLGRIQSNGTTVIDSSRNLTNIGTISSGAITSSGNLLVNRTASVSNADADDIQLGNTSGAHGLTILSQNTHNGNIYFADNDNNDAGSIRYNHPGNRIEFFANRAERARITEDAFQITGIIQQTSATDCGVVHPRENLDGVPMEAGLAYYGFNHNTSTHPSTESDFDTMIRTNVTSLKGTGTWNNASAFTFSADNYLVEFHGYLLVTTAGDYRFGVNADDAVDLYIDGVRVADHYGGHGAGSFLNQNSRTSIYLTVGYHKLYARFEEVSGGDSIQLGWNGGSGTTLSAIPAANLYRGRDDNFKNYGGTTYGVGNITMTGNVTAYSDEKLKSDIQTLDGSKVLQMRGVSFTKDGEAGSGVIAQELEKVAPELVHDGEFKSVAYGNLVGYLIEAVKMQQQQIDRQQAQINDLIQAIKEKDNGDH